MCLFHAVLHALDLALDLFKLALCVLKLIFKVGDSLFQGGDLVLEVLLNGLLTTDCLFMCFLDLAYGVGVILLFLGKLSIKIRVELSDKFFMLLLQLFNLLSVLFSELIDLIA